MKGVFCQSQRLIEIFTCDGQKCNFASWNNHCKKLSNNKSENNPRKWFNKQRVNSTTEVGTEKSRKTTTITNQFIFKLVSKEIKHMYISQVLNYSSIPNIGWSSIAYCYNLMNWIMYGLPKVHFSYLLEC